MHNHDFINKHTAIGILMLVIGCFIAGYFVGQETTKRKVMESFGIVTSIN